MFTLECQIEKLSQFKTIASQFYCCCTPFNLSNGWPRSSFFKAIYDFKGHLLSRLFQPFLATRRTAQGQILIRNLVTKLEMKPFQFHFFVAFDLIVQFFKIICFHAFQNSQYFQIWPQLCSFFLVFCLLTFFAFKDEVA